MIFLKKEYRNLKKMKKCSHEEPCFAPLNEKDVPQNTNLRSAVFRVPIYSLLNKKNGHYENDR